LTKAPPITILALSTGAISLIIALVEKLFDSDKRKNSLFRSFQGFIAPLPHQNFTKIARNIVQFS